MQLLGDVAARSGDFAAAESYFGRAIELDPNAFSSYVSLFFVRTGYFREDGERSFSPRSLLLLKQAEARLADYLREVGVKVDGY